jgi:DNA-directed RNA polymerase specialized sigma24 family protein
MERYASRLYRVACRITQNAADAREVVRRAISPDQYWTVLVLRNIEELSNEEVAEILGESLAAVKSRLHRARMALREQLTKISVGGRSARPGGEGAACLVGRKWLGGARQRQER